MTWLPTGAVTRSRRAPLAAGRRASRTSRALCMAVFLTTAVVLAIILDAATTPVSPAGPAMGASAPGARPHGAIPAAARPYAVAPAREAAAGAESPLPALAASEAVERVFLDIDVARCVLTVYVDTMSLRQYPIAVGKPATPSPAGIWVIAEKSRWGGGFGTRWMRLSVSWGTYGVHGTSNPGSVGQAVSGGCIRMLNRDVEELYELAAVGTQVRISGGPPCWGFGEVRRDIRPGALGSDVAAAQDALYALGFYDGARDGFYGPDTVQAVRAFQRARGLAETGSVSDATYRLLGLTPAAEDPALRRRQ